MCEVCEGTLLAVGGFGEHLHVGLDVCCYYGFCCMEEFLDGVIVFVGYGMLELLGIMFVKWCNQDGFG